MIKRKKTLKILIFFILVALSFIMPQFLYAAPEEDKAALKAEMDRVVNSMTGWEVSDSKEAALATKKTGYFVLSAKKEIVDVKYRLASAACSNPETLDYITPKNELTAAFNDLSSTKFKIVSLEMAQDSLKTDKGQIAFIENLDDINKTYLEDSVVKINVSTFGDKRFSKLLCNDIESPLEFILKENTVLRIISIDIKELKDELTNIENNIIAKSVTQKDAKLKGGLKPTYHTTTEDLATLNSAIKKAKETLNLNVITQEFYNAELNALKKARKAFTTNAIDLTGTVDKPKISSLTIAAIVIMFVVVISPAVMIVTKIIRDKKLKKEEQSQLEENNKHEEITK